MFHAKTFSPVRGLKKRSQYLSGFGLSEFFEARGIRKKRLSVCRTEDLPLQNRTWWNSTTRETRSRGGETVECKSRGTTRDSLLYPDREYGGYPVFVGRPMLGNGVIKFDRCLVALLEFVSTAGRCVTATDVRMSRRVATHFRGIFNFAAEWNPSTRTSAFPLGRPPTRRPRMARPTNVVFKAFDFFVSFLARKGGPVRFDRMEWIKILYRNFW